MKFVKFNLNHEVRVKIKERGISHYVNRYNEYIPKHISTSFHEFQKQADKEGYHTMQMYQFMNYFGFSGLGIDLLVDSNVFIKINESEQSASLTNNAIAYEDLNSCFDMLFQFVEKQIPDFDRKNFIDYVIMNNETIQLFKLANINLK